LFKEVLAIEPYHKVYARLQEQVRKNQISNIRLLTHGLGIKEETLEFYPPATQNTGTGTFMQPVAAVNPIHLQIRRGDDVLRENHVPSNALIKIDTEGFEPAVLEGLHDFIRSNQPVLFFEWSQNGIQSDHAFNQTALLPASYVCYQFLSHIPWLFFFERKSYKLRKLNGLWPDGMIVAFDREKLYDEAFRDFIRSKEWNTGP
jgi:FkbM family methyltransferase